MLGDLLSVVRIKRDMRPPLNETDLMARLNTVDEQSALSALMVHTLDRFIGSHILRITLPSGITAALKGNARSMSGNTLDINLSRALGEGKPIHDDTCDYGRFRVGFVFHGFPAEGDSFSRGRKISTVH